MTNRNKLFTTKEEIITTANGNFTEELVGGYINNTGKWMASTTLEAFTEVVEELGFEIVKVISDGKDGDFVIVRTAEGITISQNGFVTIARLKKDVDEEVYTTKEEVIATANKVSAVSGRKGGFVNTDGKWSASTTLEAFTKMIEGLGFKVKSTDTTETGTPIVVTTDGIKLVQNGFVTVL